ncbi:hypothetical protein L226DRAFT_483399 [Lentinus tigrinus ALCF2SS1-7]|uniref:uncharacterized protein n=1 Tax=Lentinus tigrinus ALCF2SS1-7 TaxID=1328758 RepID=UPI0011663C94|nr:hypothetical protein L226DRAFT_483399 [Lentinus tigrinus ALCF2SS1-7]
MARLRRDTQDSGGATTQRPLRVVASGTLFVTNNLGLPTHPDANSVVRAHTVSRDRGGSASTCLSIVAQFPAVDAVLVAPLGGNEEGQRIIAELEKERVSTRYCKVWPEAGVPQAWVLHAGDTDSRTVINNNPLPDITHEEFISLTGPLIVPENYAYLNSSLPSTPPAGIQQTPGVNAPGQPRPSTSNQAATPPARTVVNSPAPIDWVHFEGRSVKTTLSNIMGLDGLARERKWRSHCVFSVDVGRRARQGVEALIPHADVLFLNKHYARAHSPQYASSPRAFLLSLTNIAPQHALLVAHWGNDGASVLSVPTREYFQSSGWVEPNVPPTAPVPDPAAMRNASRMDDADLQSVRTGSDFWAGGGHDTESSSMFTADLLNFGPGSGSGSSSSPARRPPADEEIARYQRNGPKKKQDRSRRNEKRAAFRDEDDGSSSDSDGTQIAGHGGGFRPVLDAPRRPPPSNEVVDEVGAQDAFVAGMMWALSRRLLPGEPYTPSAVGSDATVAGAEGDILRGKWRLEECLRFATELAGRKARRKGWTGLAAEMAAAGWFEL